MHVYVVQDTHIIDGVEGVFIDNNRAFELMEKIIKAGSGRDGSETNPRVYEYSLDGVSRRLQLAIYLSWENEEGETEVRFACPSGDSFVIPTLTITGVNGPITVVTAACSSEVPSVIRSLPYDNQSTDKLNRS